MALFGERCVRCGKRTRDAFEGLPTCPACEAGMQSLREPPRLCPLDGTVMQKAIVHNVVTDKCPACQGVWLDGGELNLISEALRSEGGGDFASGFLLGMVVM